MYGGKNKVIFIKERVAGQVSRCGRRVKCQFCKKAFPGGIFPRDLLELLQISLTGIQTIVNALKVRLVPVTTLCDPCLPTMIICFPRRKRVHQVKNAGQSTRVADGGEKFRRAVNE